MEGSYVIVRSKGRPDRLPTKLCKDAAKFYGNLLLGKMHSKVEVLLDFTDELDPGIHAQCVWDDNNRNCKKFHIEINPTMGKRNMLLAIAHEMVHVKQYAKREMVDYINGNNAIKLRWQGEIFDLKKNSDYWEHPWEIEAFGRERGLYYKYLIHEEHLRKAKAKKRRK